MFLESDCGRAMIDLCSKMCFALLVFRYVAGLARMHLVYQENPSFLLSEPGERRGELTPSSFCANCANKVSSGSRRMARAAHSSSGLTFSAAFGVRDANEASWTQVLEGVEFMADAVGIPDAEYVRGLSRRGGAHMASIRAALNSVVGGSCAGFGRKLKVGKQPGRLQLRRDRR